MTRQGEHPCRVFLGHCQQAGEWPTLTRMNGWSHRGILAIVLALCACSKSTKEITPDRVRFGEDGKWYLDGKPWSGKQSAQFPNGRLQFEGELKEGLQHGEWKWYYESGNVESSIQYDMGRHDGNETHRYDNERNSLMWVRSFRKGVFLDAYQWLDDGTPVTKATPAANATGPVGTP